MANALLFGQVQNLTRLIQPTQKNARLISVVLREE